MVDETHSWNKVSEVKMLCAVVSWPVLAYVTKARTVASVGSLQDVQGQRSLVPCRELLCTHDMATPVVAAREMRRLRI